MSARQAPVRVRQAVARVAGPVDVTAGWAAMPGGGRGMVLVGTFATVPAAVKWVRSNPQELQGHERAEIRSDRDYLSPVARFKRTRRGWVVES